MAGPEPPRPAAELGDHEPRQIGPYRIVGRLGRGGMGAVYLGESPDGTRVAIKVVRPELADDDHYRERFRREVVAAQRVQPFCTAPVLDARTDSEPLYVVTQYIQGDDLAETVRAQGPFKGGDLDAVAIGVLTALSAIHAVGIVHRDIKPGNVLLSPTGLRVIDFGVAKPIATEAHLTHTGAAVGTPSYMAPEVLVHGEASPAADIFGWACLVLFAATGKSPFRGQNIQSIMYQVLHHQPELDGLGDGPLRKVVERALDKDPAKRPSADEALGMLLGRKQEKPTENVIRSRMTIPVLPRRKRSLWTDRNKIVLAAAVTVIALAATAVKLWPDGGGEHGNASSPPSSTKPADALTMAMNSPPSGEVVHQNNFAEEAKDKSSQNWTGGYVTGGLNFTVDQDSEFMWQDMPGGYEGWSDELVQAKLRLNPDGTSNLSGGVICFATDPGKTLDAYEFVVAPDGNASVSRIDDSEVRLLDTRHTGFAVNNRVVTVTALCASRSNGVRLVMWVDGQKLLDKTDTKNPIKPGVGGIIGHNLKGAGSVVYSSFDFSEPTLP